MAVQDKQISIFNILFILFCIIFFSSPIRGNAFQSQIEEFKQKIERYKNEGNQKELANYLNKLAYVYWQIDALNEASNYFQQSLSINQELGNKNAQRIITNNLGLIHSELEDYQKAIDFFEKSLQFNLNRNNNEDIISDLLNIAMALHELKFFAESNNRAEQALEKALEIDNLQLTKSCFGLIAENYENLGDAAKAAEYFEKYGTVSKHLQTQEVAVLESRSEAFKAEAKKKEVELKSTLDTLGEVLQMNREMQLQNELLNKESQLAEMARKEELARSEAREKLRKMQLTLLSLVLGLLIIISLIILNQFRQKKKANIQLQNQNAQIEKQKAEIEEQRDLAEKQKQKITDSIQYARRIQAAVMPPEEILTGTFRDSFILYKPRDIVSGDFYWLARKENLLIVAAADCTGHGVPGALMSMLGVSFLNEIVNKMVVNKHISALNADEILNQLRNTVISSLHQTGEMNEPRDGMDIALTIFDLEARKVQFAGAHNPFYLIRNGELIQYKADRMPVSFHRRKDVPFTKHEIVLEPNDCIYLFSDGYIDQFGGPKGMKFLSKRFKALLTDIHDRPMPDQRKILDAQIEEWKGPGHQLDDILVIGIRFAKVSSRQGSEIEWPDKTVLIAEDTDINYFLLVEALKQTKVKVIRVKDGVEAIEFVKSNLVDLILMDINMPNMNGYEATSAIKAYHKDIPIIVQTAMNMADERDLARAAGADDFISKPIDLKTFIAKINQYLS